MADVEDALRDLDVPSENRTSLSSYLSQVRGALREVLGDRLPSGAIHVPKGSSSIVVAGFRSAVRELGGSEVRSVR